MALFNVVVALKGALGVRDYKYSALPGPERSQREQAQEREYNYRRLSKRIIVGMALFAVLLIVLANQATPLPTKNLSCDSVQDGYACATDISRSWGQYTPFFSVPSAISADVPVGCSLTFAQVLSRHGARDPTEHKSEAYQALIKKIQTNTTAYGAGFEFLQRFSYTLGKDELTEFGEQELYNSGVKFYERYETLAANSTPFFRASDQNRVVQSAKNFTQGFHMARTASIGQDDESFPYNITLVSEEDGSNNTLSHGLCSRFEEGAIDEIGDNAKSKWAAIFVPTIQTRVNENIPGANLTIEETLFLMDMCPFVTVADAAGTPSQFCALFTTDEWISYNYYQSLDKWYGYGPGNPLGPTQGVGWVNELVARLTNTSVVDHTNTNTTLDSDPVSFPLGLPLYADFSHDNDMTSIYSALGLFAGTDDLDMGARKDLNGTNGYSAAVTVPFAARMYVEKMICQDTGIEKEMVRVLLNDRVMPLDGCNSDALGRCSLANFVNSMTFAQSGGLWDTCFT